MNIQINVQKNIQMKNQMKHLKIVQLKGLKKYLKKKQEKPTKDLKEATGLNNKSTTNWYDKNKFNEILTTIDNNNFNHKNKIGK